MSKTRAAQRRTPRPLKLGAILERLEPDEACAVLHRLLAVHPDLRAEAERAARSLLSEVSFESVADDVEDALRSLDIEDLESRAGRHGGGYTSPTDAASELLEEAVDPFLSDMKRQIDLGLDREALEICKGILLGLYRIRDTRVDEFLGWAEDFPAEAAVDAVRVLAQGEQMGAGGKRFARLHFGPEFVDKHVPKWKELIVPGVVGRGMGEVQGAGSTLSAPCAMDPRQDARTDHAPTEDPRSEEAREEEA